MFPPLPADLLAAAYGPEARVAAMFAGRAEDGFYNGGPDETDHLCGALVLPLTRGGVWVTCDERATHPGVRAVLARSGTALGPPDQTIPTPPALRDLGDADYANALIAHLGQIAPPGTLVMCQPYQDPRLAPCFRLSPALSAALNDKARFFERVPAAAPPPRLVQVPDGDALRAVPWPGEPCVVKLAGSCAGQGVWPCADADAWARAVDAVAGAAQPVLVERWIQADHNLDLEFLIPADPEAAPVVLGAVLQVVDAHQKLIGGVIHPPDPCPHLPALEAWLHAEIFPALRALGWHGLGGLDVLVERGGRAHVIDPNLRPTDFTAPLVAAQDLPPGTSALILPYARYPGPLDAFEREVLIAAPPTQRLRLQGILDHGDRLLFSGILPFDSAEALRDGAGWLVARGVSARALEAAEPLARVLYLQG